MKKIYASLLLILILVSCNKYPEKLDSALNQADTNRNELEKVLDFYKINPEDSLKYKAAVFLIENMPYHFSYKPISGFEEVFDSISHFPMDGPREGTFKKILKENSENKTFDNPELIPDINHISSQFLITNIELAFKAWNNIPKEKRASFEDFCNYILPYKTGNEPIEEITRQKFLKKYSWVNKSLAAGVPLQVVVDSVASNFKFKVLLEISKFYPQSLSISQVEKTRFGLCPDGVNYLVNVFRALGIASATDMTPHWGNHPTMGHNWLYVKYGNEEYATDVIGKIDLKTLYINESIPKVLRTTYNYQEKNSFSPLAVDVTPDYITTTNITIANLFKATHSRPVLCVFDVNKEWDPIALGSYKNDSFLFSNIGTNVLYMVGSHENNVVIPANYPFFLDNSKKIHFFKPNTAVLGSALLTRKYRLSTPKTRKSIEIISNLNGGLFQGANHSDFSDAETLYQISKFNSTHLKNVVLKTKKKFKYVRFYSNGKKTSLAKLAFYGAKGEELRGDVIQKNIKNFNLEWSAFDEDPLSYSGGEDFSLGFAFAKPTTISAIAFQVKNDMNHIIIGNEYELFYWNKHWKTLGVQVAKDTVLAFNNIPANSLLWLKNNTGGTEEQVFFIDKNRKQHWPGSDNY